MVIPWSAKRPGPRPQARTRAARQGAIWEAIRRNTEPWTTRSIAEATGSPLSTVQQYVVALQRGGYVRRIKPSMHSNAGAAPAVWRTIWRHRDAAAPIVTWRSRIARDHGQPTPTERDEWHP